MIKNYKAGPNSGTVTKYLMSTFPKLPRSCVTKPPDGWWQTGGDKGDMTTESNVDPGTGKEILVKNLGNLNKVCGLVGSTEPVSVYVWCWHWVGREESPTEMFHTVFIALLKVKGYLKIQRKLIAYIFISDSFALCLPLICSEHEPKTKERERERSYRLIP